MILEAMYNGEFYPCETVVPTSPEYRKAIQTCAVLMEQLSQRLSKEDYALVEELRAQNYFRSLFAVGFQGLLILVCVAIYAVLIQSIATDGDVRRKFCPRYV